MFRQCLTPCVPEVFHCISVHSKIATLKMGVNKQFITNNTSSAKKRFLKSLKTPAMQWTSVAYSIVIESV